MFSYDGGMSRELRVVGTVTPEVLARVASATKLDTLEEVLRWGGDIADVVVQDEYTHDVVLKAPAFLVFDTT
jgi:hypothetical protein